MSTFNDGKNQDARIDPSTVPPAGQQFMTADDWGKVLHEVGREAWIGMLNHPEYKELASTVVTSMVNWEDMHPAQRLALTRMAERFSALIASMFLDTVMVERLPVEQADNGSKLDDTH